MEYSALKQIINKYDPAGLLALGAPENEYDAEIRSILNKLRKDQNTEETKTIVYVKYPFW